MRKNRVAIVGTAGTWGRFFTHAYAASLAYTIIKLVDRAKERNDSIAARFGVEPVYKDLDY